jgi:hypothetical protein
VSSTEFVEPPSPSPNKIPGYATASRETIYIHVDMFRATCCVVGSIRARRRHLLTEEKLGEMDDRLNTSTNS